MLALVSSMMKHLFSISWKDSNSQREHQTTQNIQVFEDCAETITCENVKSPLELQETLDLSGINSQIPGMNREVCFVVENYYKF